MGTVEYESLLENLALVFTILLQLSPLPIVIDVVTKKSTDGHTPFCFLCAVFGSALWLKYGLMTGFSTMMVAVLIVSFISDMTYLTIFYVYTEGKKLMNRYLLLIAGIVFSSIWYVDYSGVERAVGESRFGLLVCVSTIVFAAAPLTVVGQVVQIKSSEPLPCLLIISTFFLSIVWCLYGVVVKDQYVMVPNGVSIVIGFVQLSLFLIYPRKRRSFCTSSPTMRGWFPSIAVKQILIDEGICSVWDPLSEGYESLETPKIEEERDRINFITPNSNKKWITTEDCNDNRQLSVVDALGCSVLDAPV